MARRPVLPPPEPTPKRRSKRTIPAEVVVDKSALSPVSLEATVEELKEQAKALDLAAAGCSHREIANELGIHILKVPRLLTDALGELFQKRDAAADKFFALHRRRYDILIRQWLPKATDRMVSLKNEDGAIVETFVPADPKAAMIMAKLQADYAKMFGFNKLRVEHTGAHGGPILNLNANIDWSRATDEQLAQAAAGNQEVIALLSGAGPGSSSAGDASSREGEDGSSSGRH